MAATYTKTVTKKRVVHSPIGTTRSALSCLCACIAPSFEQLAGGLAIRS